MSPVDVPEKWDYETDVLILGAGTGGLPAGITAAEAGFKATVLESRPKAGGSFAMVAGAFAIAGSDEQKELGIEDSNELFYQDFMDVCDADPEVARAFVDHQIESYRMLKDEGVKFPGIVPHPCHSRERCLGWIGGLGPKFVKALLTRCERSNVEILYKHRARKLIKDPQSGRIMGATVEVGDDTKMFKANKGVILASGGFGRNKELIFEYEPIMVNAIPKMPMGHQGDGLIMALDVGAATKDIGISIAPSWPLCRDPFKCHMAPRLRRHFRQCPWQEVPRRILFRSLLWSYDGCRHETTGRCLLDHFHRPDTGYGRHHRSDRERGPNRT
jgi:fumarate reductase flavoprotein subunit